LTGPIGLPILPRTSRTAGCERDEYPSRRRPRDPAAGASRDGDDGEWTREPPDRTERGGCDRPTSRLRRRAPAIAGSADRPRRGPSVTRARLRRRRVVPRKVRPFVPSDGRSVDSGAPARRHR
jgi:hypothetical protein